MRPVNPPATLRSRPVSRLKGRARPPGDKSISHRALILGAVAIGETLIEGLLEASDVAATAGALRCLGVDVERLGKERWRVSGVGVGGLAEPNRILDLGNSGTGARLLMGLVASQPMLTFFTGDASLSRRPMARVTDPLAEMGARITARSGGFLPLSIAGAADPVPITHRLKVPSAQVKSAILLAGLNAPGRTSVIETAPTRDHTEILLRHFGAEVLVEDDAGERTISLTGYPELAAARVEVPADPSSAAFAGVAALITGSSDLTLNDVSLNPLRAGLYQTLREMGASIDFGNERLASGERVADLRFRSSELRGVTVPASRAPSMIDEYPVLAVAAACARGTTVLEGLGELKHKESDRLAAIANGLAGCGVEVEAGEDSLSITGTGKPPPGQSKKDAPVETHGDHRIAMAFLTLGAGAANPVAVDSGHSIETSFPDFTGFMNALGTDIGVAGRPKSP
ncbi:MAG: 3-phosphoshikimate 1-carboxyvinyltransferase [Alphaproteobacteria bacterium]